MEIKSGTKWRIETPFGDVDFEITKDVKCDRYLGKESEFMRITLGPNIIEYGQCFNTQFIYDAERNRHFLCFEQDDQYYPNAYYKMFPLM